MRNLNTYDCIAVSYLKLLQKHQLELDFNKSENNDDSIQKYNSQIHNYILH